MGCQRFGIGQPASREGWVDEAIASSEKGRRRRAGKPGHARGWVTAEEPRQAGPGELDAGLACELAVAGIAARLGRAGDG